MEEIVDIKRQIIQKIGSLGSKYYQNSQNSLVFTAILMSHEGSTQDQLIKLTGFPRTTVSEALTALKHQGLISRVKLTKARKKNYSIQMEMHDAIRLYLQKLIDNFENSVEFVQKMLDALYLFTDSDKEESQYLHFFQYLQQLKETNLFVITYFKQFFYRTFIPPKTTINERMEIISKLLFLVESTINKTRSETIPKERSNLLIKDKNLIHLDEIKKEYLRKFQLLMEKTEKQPLYSVLVNLLYIEVDSPTQDRIQYLLDIPRSTLSEALKKVEKDRLISLSRFQSDGKIHYFPSIPRNLLLPTKFFSLLKSLWEITQFLSEILEKIEPNEKDQQELKNFVQITLEEYNVMVDFLIFFENKFSKEFKIKII